MTYFITGTAGFIGFHLARRLLDAGRRVVGLDGMTAYYDVELKRRRHAVLRESALFTGHEFLLEDFDRLAELMAATRPEVVIHLAAQAGVRYSLENPRAYLEANVVGTFNLLEQARITATPHLMLASTSSVYGSGAAEPFTEASDTDHPLSLYAATKKSTEAIAHSYAHLFEIPTTVFRFFTVYGPWGRPDMAFFKFTKSIIEGTPIEIYNHGRMERDFTYVADLVEAIERLARLPPQPPTGEDDRLLASTVAPYRIVNIGNGEPVRLLDFIGAIETAVGRQALRTYLPMQSGDVPRTWADTSLLRRLTGYAPSTSVPVGIAAFVAWYRDYHGLLL